MKVNTVLGPIDGETLGVTLMHEHVLAVNSAMLMAFGKKWADLDKVADIVSAQFRQVREQYGIQTIVDATPVNLGRNLVLLQEVSRRSGVQIVASSGLYYTDEPFLVGKPAEQLAEIFIDECQSGIEGSAFLPGILKCATDRAGITPVNRLVHTALALVQKETDLPVYAHTFPGLGTGLEQLQIFLDSGCDPSRIIIGHSADSFDLSYHEALLQQGCYLGLDRIRDDMPGEKIRQWTETVYALCERGWIDRLVLSHDICGYDDFGDRTWESYAAQKERINRYGYLHEVILPQLMRMGLTKEQLDRLLVDNPRRVLTGEKE